MAKLLDLVESHPDVIVSIRAADLLAANEELIKRTRQELEQLITDANTETYPSAKKVAEMLDVDKSTLWRWAKVGYLVPINVGGKRRYRMSDVKRILEGDKDAEPKQTNESFLCLARATLAINGCHCAILYTAQPCRQV